MPISHELNTELTRYTNKYLENTQHVEKRKKVLAISQSITAAADGKHDDQACIQLLFDIGTQADTEQAPGQVMDVAHYKIVETLYMLAHRIRHNIDEKAIDTRYAVEKKYLADARTAYFKAVKENQLTVDTEKTLQGNIDACLRRMAYLGKLEHLYELDLEEIQRIYPGNSKIGYEYSPSIVLLGRNGVAIHLPLVIQPGVFEDIYLLKHYQKILPGTITPPADAKLFNAHAVAALPFANGKAASVATPADVKAAPQRVVNSAAVASLISHLDAYTAEKIKDRDYASKTTACFDIRTRLNVADKENYSTDKWLDVVVHIGDQADKIQHAGTTCSGCTETFYLVLHELRQEIQKNDAAAFATRIARETEKLTQLKLMASHARYNNQTLESINAAEKAVYDQMLKLAYLGETDHLLALNSSKLLNLYPNQLQTPEVPGLDKVPYLGKAFASLVNSALKTVTNAVVSAGAYVGSDTTMLKFEYPKTSNPYGVGTKCFVRLPLVHSAVFPQIFYNKYPKLREQTEIAKQAAKDAEQTLTELNTEVNALLPTTRNLARLNAADEKALAEGKYTFENVQAIKSELKPLDDKIQAAEAFIAKTVSAQKPGFKERLMPYITQIIAIKDAAANAIKTFEKAHDVAEQAALGAAQERQAQVTQFLTSEVCIKVMNVKNNDAKSIDDTKITVAELTTLDSTIETLSECKTIDEHLKKCRPDRQGMLRDSLLKKPIQDKLAELKAASVKIREVLVAKEAEAAKEVRAEETVAQLAQELASLTEKFLPIKDLDAKELTEAKITAIEIKTQRARVTDFEQKAILPTRALINALASPVKQASFNAKVDTHQQTLAELKTALEKIEKTLQLAVAEINVKQGVDAAANSVPPSSTAMIFSAMPAAAAAPVAVVVSDSKKRDEQQVKEFLTSLAKARGVAAGNISGRVAGLFSTWQKNPEKMRGWMDEFTTSLKQSHPENEAALLVMRPGAA